MLSYVLVGTADVKVQARQDHVVGARMTYMGLSVCTMDIETSVPRNHLPGDISGGSQKPRNAFCFCF